ncbi:type II secretion system protein [Aedoeadaptatus urinae]|uniref:type II secretion system protein n=1 Tax=Aedoeadaptatus urinae TaxID=1871017 RepID=UPI00097D4B7E|nr:type II secretion system protein [Peptoniphilus urinae]
MKKSSFTLLEVMVAVAIVGLITVMLSAFLGGSSKQLSAQEGKRNKLDRASDTMESYMAYEDRTKEGMDVRISDYDARLEKVEVFDAESGKQILVALRPKKSLYTP